MRQARGESICQRVLRHWTHRAAAASFECWHAHALEQKRMEQVCTRIVDKMLNHSLDAAMMTWRDHARKQHRATEAGRAVHDVERSSQGAEAHGGTVFEGCNDDAPSQIVLGLARLAL